MGILERHVDRVRRRLWFNRWLRQSGWALAAGWGAWGAVVILERLFSFGMALGHSAVALTVLAVVASVAWSVVSREDRLASAEALDRTAGLRERVTSGLYCAGHEDPFARSVYGDAVRAVRRVSIAGHLPIRYPRSFNWSLAAILGSLMVAWWMPSYDVRGVLARQRRAEQNRRDLKSTQVALQQTVERVKPVAKHPETLEALKELDELTQPKPAESAEAEELRREAVKRLDRLSDRLKAQSESAQYDQLDEIKKVLSRLNTDPRAEGPVERLNRALAKGDFKAAAEALKTVQEQLARSKTPEDKAGIADMQRKLADLSKQLERLAGQDRLKDKLQQAGLSEKDTQDLLEHLAKRTPESIRRDIQKKGLNPEQIERLMKQLGKTQAGLLKCQGLAGSLASAAGAMSGSGDVEVGQAQAALVEVGERLSEMEALEPVSYTHLTLPTIYSV